MSRSNNFFLLFFFLFFFTKVIYAQNSVIDSLKIELKNHKAKDTIRVNILNHLAFHHYRNDPPKAIVYVGESLKLAKELGVKKFIAHSYYIKAVVYTEQANFLIAIPNYDKAIQYYSSLNDLKGIEKCKNALGVLYTYKGEYELALKSYEDAMAIAKKRKDESIVLTYLYNIGVIYSEKGNYDKALDLFNKALYKNRKEKDSVGIINNLNTIAGTYYEQGNYPVSLKYYNESLHIAKSSKDSIGVFQAYINIGNLYRMKNDNNKALNYYNKAQAIKSASYNIKNVTALKNNIAGIYYDNEEYNRAITIFNESIKLSREIGDDLNIATALNGLGFVYFESKQYSKALISFEEAKNINIKNNFLYDLLDSYQGLADSYFKISKYDLALDNAKKLLMLAKEINSLRHKKLAYGIFSEIYKQTGNYKKAFENQELFKVMSDSLLNEENIKKIAGIEYEYKYKKDLDDAAERETKLNETVEITSKDLEKSQRNLLLGIITFLAVAMILGSIIFFLKLRNSKAKTQNIITEQKLLRTQMTPHFIFNSLSVLQGMILNKEEIKSVSYLSKFSKLLRITLENSRDKIVLLSKELEAVENYLSLQNIEKEVIEFKLIVDNSIDVNNIKVPPMLIQPFVENAIEHAFKNQKENNLIEININLVDSKLTCVILDNGMGIDSSERNANQNKKSLATKITSERLQYLSKDFKMEGSITIEDRSKFNEKGTQVTIQIPYS
jgi:tetratricopeptide (TPR) repeat protein